MKEKKEILKELQQIPGVGKAVALDLYELGYKSISELKGQDPEIMYVLHNNQKRAVQDVCMLYTFRAAVYYAETLGKKQDPEKLKWWNWMDKKKMSSVEKDAEIRLRLKDL
jgi:hypothetical protein